ncbi:MAG: hypothetical protein LBU40_05975, partial [Methanobrevibacter sp.]|nr:hypothetical protein [Methanobrevibacter sp.]
MKNNLLRLRNALSKHGKQLEIKHKHKESLTRWYKKYKTGDLNDEVPNYPLFQKCILEKLLGYKYDEDFKFEYPLGQKHVEFMILKDNEPYIAIELKGTDIDLTKSYGGLSAVEQASNYASKKSTIEWYIVSNYYEFRLYNANTQHNYILFTLDDLKHDNRKFKEFLLIFSKESILNKGILNKLLDKKGLFAQDFNIEDEFYKLYSETRSMLIKELEYSNDINKNTAISKAQLILNRYIFICFCEDKDLLPDNTTNDEILTPIRRKVLAVNTLWNRLNELFYFINNGNEENDITAFNGGLFKEDISYLR